MLPVETLEKWLGWARQDNACDLFVPSDIRQMLGEIYHLRGMDELRPHTLDVSKEYVLRSGMRVVSLKEIVRGYDVRAMTLGLAAYEFGFSVRGDGTYGFNAQYDLLPKPSN